jgi:hypothetical protein
VSSPLDALLDEFATRVAAHVIRQLRGPASADMVAQAASPLGSRRHCRAVRRRIEAGKGGAAIVGRRFLLSAEALREELARCRGEARPAEPSAVRAELERELSFLRPASGGGR